MALRMAPVIVVLVVDFILPAKGGGRRQGESGKRAQRGRLERSG